MQLSSVHHLFLSFRNVLLIATVLRVALILYSEWHDLHSVVKYTDVDYRVFSDAAHFILHAGPGETNHAQGPLKHIFGFKIYLGDPYTRDTYRYTPLLALLLTPNRWLHPSFGKYLFAACDLVNGALLYALLVSEIPPTRSHPAAAADRASADTGKTSNTDTHTPSELPTQEFSDMRRAALASACSAVHLLNPLVFSISTRGSSESVLSLFVLLALRAALRGRWDAAAVMLGLSVHWKIYPVIYCVGCLGVVGGGTGGGRSGWRGYLGSLVNRRTVRFATVSGGTFLLLGASCYLIWGYPFLHESYLYHLHRLDHRHNFSPYFYLTYLTYPALVPPYDPMPVSWWSAVARSPLVGFMPQMALALGAGLIFGRRREHLVFTWFVQTAVFVLFNKVCTSQYFLWYLLLLPLLLPRLSTTRLKGLAYAGVWAGTQALWLSEAYRLEFLGQSVFLGLWFRGLIYVMGNAWVLGGIMSDYVM